VFESFKQVSKNGHYFSNGRKPKPTANEKTIIMDANVDCRGGGCCQALDNDFELIPNDGII
jgi:hypothetical protein